MLKRREEWKLEEEMIDSERRVGQTVDTLLQNQKTATKQEQALQDETTPQLQERELPERQTLRLLAHSVLRISHKM